MNKTNFFDEGSPYLEHPLLTRKRTLMEIDFLLSKIDLPDQAHILDVGCGPGRHSIELALRGYQVVGIDPSATMIEAAQSRASNAGVEPVFLQVAGEVFKTNKKFDTALCLFTTLGQINDRIDNSSLVFQVASALRPTGYFIVEVPHLKWVKKNLKPVDHFDDGDIATHIFRNFDPIKRVVTEEFKLISEAGENHYLLKYRLYSQADIVELLKNAGFNIIAIYGGYQEIQLEAESPVMLIIAQKVVSEQVS